MTSAKELFIEPSRLSRAVRDLGYSGSPLLLDEWLKLQETIRSMSQGAGSKRMHLPLVILSCVQCQKTFLRQSGEVAKHMRKGLDEFVCSSVCWGRRANEKNHGRRSCLRCGQPAPKKTSCGSRSDGRVFCSKACMTAERQEEFEQRALTRLRPCRRCNAMFMPSNVSIRFCGRECASRHHAGQMAKEGNPRWKDGMSASRVKAHVTRRFREMRPLVMRRDGMRCILCEHDGTKNRLEVHHVDENALNNRAVNLITVCVKCHKRVHSSKERSTLLPLLKRLAEKPMSTTYKWAKRNASLPTAS